MKLEIEGHNALMLRDLADAYRMAEARFRQVAETSSPAKRGRKMQMEEAAVALADFILLEVVR